MSLFVTLALMSLAAAPTAAPAAADSACPVLMPDKVPVQGRQSPLDSLTFTAGGQTVKLCYGRASARGRKMIGGENVPYGKLWRTGANEPTVIFTPVALDIAGVKVAAGEVLDLFGAQREGVGDHREPQHQPVGPREHLHARKCRPKRWGAARRRCRSSPSRWRPSRSYRTPHRARCSISISTGRRPGSWCRSRPLAESQRARANRATPASNRSTSSAVV